MKRLFCSLLLFLLAATRTSVLHAGFLHQDIESHVVKGSVFPPIAGGTWTVDSRMDILSAEPHFIPSGTTVGFHFREFYNLTAGLFTPLIVPGTPNAPASAGDPLDNKTWTFDIKNVGCAVFNYSNPWKFDINPNTGGEKNPEFELGLSKGPVSFAVKWGGGSTPPTNFLFTPLPNDLRIEFATSDKGQGFFANGGSLSVIGNLTCASDGGTGMVFADNHHYASGKGWLVNNYTMAEPDAKGSSAIVTTNVYDRYSCGGIQPTPEPSSLALLTLGSLGLLGYGWRRRKGGCEEGEAAVTGNNS